MNTTSIEWCTRSWNPVTGCRHGCSSNGKSWCFARDIAIRFAGGGYDKNGICISSPNEQGGDGLHDLEEPEYKWTKAGKLIKAAYPHCFEPTFHRYRLGEPAAVTQPQNVFTVDMGDLFGEWVPEKWIWAVADACAAAPQHNYLFLTKNSTRYNAITKRGILGSKFTLIMGDASDHIWFGASATGQAMATNALLHLEGASYFSHTFMSIEPLMLPMKLSFRMERLGWVIVGAMTGPGAAAHQPRREWVADIVDQCRAAGVPVFLKNNLAGIWGEQLIQEYPEGLRAVAERAGR